MTEDAPVIVCTVRCPRCGISSPDDARFCPHCGEAIAVPRKTSEIKGRAPVERGNRYATAGLRNTCTGSPRTGNCV